MPFPSSSLCDLLNKLEKNRSKSSRTDKIQDLDERTAVAWFIKHNESIPRRGPEAVAFLSCLFPERRPDRVFSLQVRRLETIIQRAQRLGSSRMGDLQHWRTSEGVDFASCVERVMAATDPESRPGPNITLEDSWRISKNCASALIMCVESEGGTASPHFIDTPLFSIQYHLRLAIWLRTSAASGYSLFTHG
jgi:DNA ligase N terminus